MFERQHAVREGKRLNSFGYLAGLWESASKLNQRNILRQASMVRAAKLCDLGCDTGQWTMEVASAAGASEIAGIEIVEERANQARSRGIDVTIGDLDEPWPVADNSFDLVHANQVIEHVSHVDLFVQEIYRILRVGGATIISTENGSSWHNVAAAALGWQTFSLSNMSEHQYGVGNPLALHRREPVTLGTWTHKVIFNYRGLIEFLSMHGLRIIDVKGAGYYPLPAKVGLADRRHAHFLSVLAVKDGEEGTVQSRHPSPSPMNAQESFFKVHRFGGSNDARLSAR